MKKLFTVTLFLILLFLLLTLTSRADTEEKSSASQYTVTGADGEYALTLRQGGSSTFVASGTLGDILPLVLGELVFDSVTTDERIELPEGSYKVSGTLFSSGGITVSSGTDLILSGINLTLTDGASLRVKGGRLTVESSRVSSEGVTVTLDYMASSRLTLLSGELCSLGAAPAVEIKSGEAKLLGGSTVSLGGAAVRCESHLTLAGSSALSGIGYDIITSRPVSLGEGSSSYSGDGLSVSYLGELTKGTMTELFYEAGAEHSELISLYDSQGREYELTYFESYSGRDERNFLAVYLPHTVRIYLGNTLIETQLRLSGEPVKLPEPEERCGYTHKGWYTDREGVSPYPTDTAVLADTEIYSLYRLTPPEFSVKSYLASYTGRAHTVTFDKLTHPLDSSGGSYTLAWYKDGELVGEGRELTVSSVSDSGVYSCSITYRYSTDSVTVTAENISVTIEKAVVALPIIEESRYTGSPQAPKVPVSDEYSVELPTATDAGSYPVIFTLTDPDNYRFSETDAAVSSLDYRILKADNLWTKELSVYDTYFGAELDVSASSLFGKVSFEYLSLGGEWTPEPPKTAGDYLVRAVVKGTENYSELTSDPKALTLLPDAVRTLSAISAPNKTSYTAYEMFNPDGIILLATYYSGRAEEINSSAFSVTYQQGDGFRFGDNAVILSFGGVGCAVPVTVTKASYDLTGLIFTDLTVVYNGAYQTLPAPDREIIGADGLALKYSVTGGGCAVGEYTVTLSFLCDSLECELPAPITAKLTIIPYMAEITWQNTEFIYDGTAKLPTATYVDIYGVARVAGAVGEKVNAGGPYLATAYVDDPNYILISSEATFTIDRAYYDFSSVSWSADSFVFSGSEYSVTLSGLPEGVTVAGYTDGRATTAGEYTAVATLSYDVENYYPPEPLRHVWTIERATYDLGSIRFESVTVVYDGKLHYPTISGEIPCGADGITPTYTLSSGASHVSEGEHTVTLTFLTESPNYLTPEPLYATVTVLPLGIYVSWSADTLVYSGGNLCPTAFASETAVSVSGGAIDSGSYLAYAEAVNTDYYVINAEYPFVIGKAQNGWHIPLFIDSIYASGTLLPRAEAVFGDCTVAYYSDPECTEIIPEPTEAGIYYAVATVEESRNYLPLTSSPVRFEILPVLPVSLSASITAERLVAFDVLTDDKLRVTVTYNDGASLALSTSEFSVIYFSGDSLRRTDTSVTLVFGELTLDLPVSVDYAEYDLSLVRWENTVTYYDGTPKTPELIGLPEGITVTGYSQSPTAAGEYAVYAYDPSVF